MKKRILLTLLALAGTVGAKAQSAAVKTNLAYWATTTPNLGLEIGLGGRTSLEVTGLYNPFKFSDNKQMKGWAVQPSLRWWCCRRFSGHFFGVHGAYADYDGGLERFRYDGTLVSGGLSYGYAWILGRRWNLEAEIGVGYAYMDYRKYERRSGAYYSHAYRHYFGPTKAGITFVYLFR